ncbi:dihydrofolate reductase family protein [Demequina aurantiaca]|uniref:dihydrofolate reductase family protein n=1 Tax=Demequina aurantiaca TaxID=676200 RepID=UPI003D34AC59
MSDKKTSTDATLTQHTPVEKVFPPDAAETGLSLLYRQAPRTVRLGMIQSADGKSSGPDGSSRSLNGPEDLRILRTLRSQADVVLVGAQTARRERYGDITLPPAMASTRRVAGLPDTVALAIVTHTGNLPPDLNPESTWIITTVGSPASRRLDAVWQQRMIYAGSDQLAPRSMIRGLAAHGLTRVLCEGGPTIADELLNKGLVDDYCLTTSELMGGDAATPTPPVPGGFGQVHELTGGGFTIRRWQRSA